MSEQAIINATARDKAMSLLPTIAATTTSLVEYQSTGKVVVIGGDDAMEFAPRLREKDLHAEVLLTESSVEPGEVVLPVGGRKVKIEGYLGAFKISLGDIGKPNYQLLTPDLILDLSKQPLLTMPLKPPGYFTADSSNEFSMLSSINQLGDMLGTFEKPKYFDYDASICAHGRSGKTGCTACIDACPAQAITSLIESIEVSPYLCQGGGVCASVCPTGAIRYVYPSAADTAEQVRHLLKNYIENSGLSPVIAFISESDYQQIGTWPEHYLTLVVEELASVGLELWMAALAYGASRVVMLSGADKIASVDQVMAQQLEVAQQLLQGMRINAAVLSVMPLSAINEQKNEQENEQEIAAMPAIKYAQFAAKNDKRRTLFMAIDHLAKEMDALEGEIALSAYSPFGGIQVNAEACTLCMACTSVCPAKAIHPGNAEPKLMFTEINCVQCGLCAQSCPESAISLIPRYQLNREQRRKSVVIKKDSPFLCINCGKPFATQSMITTITSKLVKHAMFQSERSLERLKMCDDCRVVDVMQDSDAMNLAQGGIGAIGGAIGTGAIKTQLNGSQNKGGQNDSADQ